MIKSDMIILLMVVSNLSASLNSTLLSVLHERLCAKTYQNKPQLFA